MNILTFIFVIVVAVVVVVVLCKVYSTLMTIYLTGVILCSNIQ